MLKKLLIIVSLVAVLLLVLVTYLTTRFVDHKEIMRATLEAQELKASRDSLLFEVAMRDTLQRELQVQVHDLQGEANDLRVQVVRLERERAEQQLTVRRLRRKEDLKNELSRKFPEMAASDWGITEVYNEEADLSIEYLLVPLWFSETFIIDHQNSKSFEAQKAKLLLVDSLQTEVIDLKDTIFNLEKANRIAYQNGYENAYAKYISCNEKYIKLLEKPQFSFGLSNIGWMLGAAAGGMLIGTQIK